MNTTTQATELLTFVNKLLSAYTFYVAKNNAIVGDNVNFYLPFGRLEKALNSNKYKSNIYAASALEYIPQWCEMFGKDGVKDSDLLALVYMVIKNTK